MFTSTWSFTILSAPVVGPSHIDANVHSNFVTPTPSDLCCFAAYSSALFGTETLLNPAPLHLLLASFLSVSVLKIAGHMIKDLLINLKLACVYVAAVVLSWRSSSAHQSSSLLM
jgi:hypothetical protein